MESNTIQASCSIWKSSPKQARPRLDHRYTKSEVDYFQITACLVPLMPQLFASDYVMSYFYPFIVTSNAVEYPFVCVCVFRAATSGSTVHMQRVMQS